MTFVRWSSALRAGMLAVVVAGLAGAPVGAQQGSERRGARAPDRRPLDGADDRLRHHAHRRDQPGDCRRGRRQAARSAGRRQGRRHRQPDRLGRRRCASTTTSSSIAASARCSRTCRQLFPGENINVGVTDEAVILSGLGLEQRGDAARRRSVEGGAAQGQRSSTCCSCPAARRSKQVMLQVRFAEVNRNALQQAGLTLFATRTSLRRAIDDAAVPGAGLRQDERRACVEFSDFLNLFFFQRDEGFGARAEGAAGPRLPPEPGRAEPDRLQRRGSQLPRRRRDSDSGRPAATAARSACTYKEFGIRLTFTPTIAGDVIRLKVRPEVSTLDFNNGIILSGLPHSGARSPAAPRPTSSCATASRSRLPG